MFQKGAITIKQRKQRNSSESEEIEVQAMISKEGIAYHEMSENNGLWAITHVPSGYAIMVFVSKSQVQRFAEAIIPMADWVNTPIEALKSLKYEIQQLQYAY